MHQGELISMTSQSLKREKDTVSQWLEKKKIKITVGSWNQPACETKKDKRQKKLLY